MRIALSAGLPRSLILVALATFLALGGGTPLSGQQLALVHEAGDRVEMADMPVRDFASGLRMETRGGELEAFSGVCFVALADSEGNVWQQYASQPFDGEGGDLDGACVPRSPLLPEGRFPEGAVSVPLGTSFGAEAIPGGEADWNFIMKRVDQSLPREGDRFLKIGDIAGESTVSPPSHLEGVDYEWVALVFMVGPSEETAERVGRDFSTLPIMIVVGAN